MKFQDSGSKKRDLRLDAIRGFFLVVMTINHMPWTSHPITGEPFGFVSSAEGFVFLSGLVAGMVYGKNFLQKGFAFCKNKVFSRARKVYLYHLATVIAVVLLAQGFTSFNISWAPSLSPLESEPGQALILAPFLLYQPAFGDILPMYVVFLLLTPFFLWGMAKKLSPLLLGMSAALWGLAQKGAWDWLVHSVFPVVSRMGIFDLLAWQALYFSGLFFGYRHARRQPLFPGKKTVFLLCGVISSVFFCLRHHIGFEQETTAHLMALAQKNHLAPLRLLNFFTLAGVLTFLAERFRPLFSCKPLAFLGQHSLQVFAAHILLVYAIFLFQDSFSDVSVLIQYLIASGCVALLFPIALWHRFWTARTSPMPVARVA